MSNTETIKIKKIGQKQMPSKFKEGETYTMTQVIDEKGRKLTGFGPWTENWKQGDEVNVIVYEDDWTDKNGITKTQLKLKDPNSQKGNYSGSKGSNYGSSSGGGKRVDYITRLSYENAVRLAPVVFKDKDKVTLSDIDQLADALASRFDPTEETLPEVDVNEDTQASSNEQSLDNSFSNDDSGSDEDVPF